MSYFASTTITTDAALRDLASQRPATRAAAASALAECEPGRRAEVAVALLASIDDPDAEVRAASALSLGELGAHVRECEGVRGVRLLLQQPALLQTQYRALLHAVRAVQA